MPHIGGVVGAQYLPKEQGYAAAQQQYASSTYQKEHCMDPGLIVMAKNLQDIIKTVHYAKDNKQAIAVRTGGHQYSGASSTDSKNILLDVSSTFVNPTEDLKIITVGNKTFVRTSVSWSLEDFIGFLTKNQLFVPTGQCTDVHVGGHVQTGGYGQLARSFGLLADQVETLEVVTHDGSVKEINKKNHPEMFYALLGGCPGNLGVVTHVTLQVYKDSNYTGSFGLQALYYYSRDKLNQLLDILVAMSDNPNFPFNYDLCISVLSPYSKLHQLTPDLFKKLKETHPQLIDSSTGLPNIPLIVIYAQWVKHTANDKPDMNWFNSLNNQPLKSSGVVSPPMSQMIGLWLFHAKREFDHPYVKRTLETPSGELAKSGWAKWISNHIDQICAPPNGLYVSTQMQCFGGKFSKMVTNRGNGTSFSWRDSTLGVTIDCFHDDDKKAQAEEWQRGTDRMVGPDGCFAKQERRLLWGSYGDWNMKNVWRYYYESEEMWKRLQCTRKEADPLGTFTPNPFCVPRA